MRLPFHKSGAGETAKRSVLCSSFAFRSRSPARIEPVLEAVRSNPCLRLLSTGTRIACAVREEKKDAHEPIVELSEGGVKYRFFFSAPSCDVYSKNLRKCIAILAYFGRFYSIDVGEAYPYLAESLMDMQFCGAWGENTHRNATDRALSSLSESNAELSSKVIRLLEENRRLSKSVSGARELFDEVFGRLEDVYKIGKSEFLSRNELGTAYHSIFGDTVERKQ